MPAVPELDVRKQKWLLGTFPGLCAARIAKIPDMGNDRQMNERDRETIKPGATLFANIAAIGAGVAMFEGKPAVMGIAAFFSVPAFYTIMRL